ncbi:hypothetical protein T03_12374 [Trichinella britovi]|uniref:Uncharacterized protein n=1 Tax=Trichinella britovi TaxID=45882 RepID=A0A0V1CU62_TRIBR|nr:hypothetical protein T03_12374 [Trichinella britovi]
MLSIEKRDRAGLMQLCLQKALLDILKPFSQTKCSSGASRKQLDRTDNSKNWMEKSQYSTNKSALFSRLQLLVECDSMNLMKSSHITDNGENYKHNLWE